MTGKPTFTSQISLGNWITIGALLVSMAVGWGVMRTQQSTNKVSIAKIESSQSAIIARLRNLEMEDARSQERYNAIQSLLNRIDGRLERIERNSE